MYIARGTNTWHEYVALAFFILALCSQAVVDSSRLDAPRKAETDDGSSTEAETGTPREATLRKLFGGAMECLLPAAFVDVRWGGSTFPRTYTCQALLLIVNFHTDYRITELFVPGLRLHD